MTRVSAVLDTAKLCAAPAAFAPDMLREKLVNSCDPARVDMIEQALAAFAACRAAAQASAAIGGRSVAAAQDYAGLAHACVQPPAPAGWRHGVRPARETAAFVLAARDVQLGLLLGDGMVFHGTFEDGRCETLPPGLVLCGPGRKLPPAQYWLDAAIGLPADARLLLDISSNRGLRRLAELTLRGSFRVTLGFVTGPQDDAVEVRLVNLGDAPIAARIKRLAIRQ